MSDRTQFPKYLLDLISQPGTVEIVLALYDRQGSATLAELRGAGIARPMSALRSLAAAGHVRRCDGGSWDGQPPSDMCVALTGSGARLASGLLKAEEWGRRNLPSQTYRRASQRGRRRN